MSNIAQLIRRLGAAVTPRKLRGSRRVAPRRRPANARALAATILAATIGSATAAELPIVKVGALPFGTLAWELDTIADQRLDADAGIRVEARPMAGSEAAKLALMTGSVDLIVTDWLWVARQRAEGDAFVFLPYSRAVGALALPAGSPIRALGDLRGKRLGVAGGPLDKSWLLLRAASWKTLGQDIGAVATPVFGAAPLLNAELAQGRIDAVLTYWPYAARIVAEGGSALLQVSDLVAQLGGGDADIPMLGFAAREDWSRDHAQELRGFMRASGEAKQRLASSDAAWQRIAPLTGTTDATLLAQFRRQYQLGIVRHWGDAERNGAARMFDLLKTVGGRDLVGGAEHLDQVIFWRGGDF